MMDANIIRAIATYEMGHTLPVVAGRTMDASVCLLAPCTSAKASNSLSVESGVLHDPYCSYISPA